MQIKKKKLCRIPYPGWLGLKTDMNMVSVAQKHSALLSSRLICHICELSKLLFMYREYLHIILILLVKCFYCLHNIRNVFHTFM